MWPWSWLQVVLNYVLECLFGIKIALTSLICEMENLIKPSRKKGAQKYQASRFNLVHVTEATLEMIDTLS